MSPDYLTELAEASKAGVFYKCLYCQKVYKDNMSQRFCPECGARKYVPLAKHWQETHGDIYAYFQDLNRQPNPAETQGECGE